MEESIPHESLVSAIVFYVLVFVLAELSRRAIDSILPKGSLLATFCLEVIGTLTICLCVFENAVIIVHYGILAFFLINCVLGFFYGYFGRGAFGNPMAPIELFYYGEMKATKFLAVVAGEVLGGYLAFSLLIRLWYYSLSVNAVHHDFLQHAVGQCKLNYQHDYFVMLLTEAAGTFAMRWIFPRLPQKIADYAIPTIIAGIFSFTIVYMGDVALDPVVGSSLFYGCEGLNQQWFMLHYWVMPIFGWLLAASIDRSISHKTKKEQEKKTKKEKKAKKETKKNK